jgi:hypothetical protein
MDAAVVVCLGRVNQTAGQHQLVGITRPAQVLEENSRCVRDHESDSHLRTREAGTGRRYAQIAGARKLEHASNADAIDCGYHRLIEAPCHAGQIVKPLDDVAPLLRRQVGGCL